MSLCCLACGIRDKASSLTVSVHVAGFGGSCPTTRRTTRCAGFAVPSASPDPAFLGSALTQLCAPLLQVSPAGHCPHHEAPEAVYACLVDWMAAVEAGRDPFLRVGEQLAINSQVHNVSALTACLIVGNKGSTTEPFLAQDGRELLVTHVAGSPRTLLERAETAVFRLRQRLM